MRHSDLMRRPTTIEEFRERIRHLRSEEGLTHGLSFRPQPTDIFITPFAKCGTTWLQQIVHGLRTRGDMDFDDISRVIPWLETSYDLGLDLHAPQPGRFRAFKSHLNWNEIPKGGQYIVSIRDPKDALVSLYRFLEGWWFEPGTIPLTTWAREQFMANPGSGYWHHLASWWDHRHDENVLLLSYEDMKRDLPQAVRTIAQFIGCELDDDLLETVVRQASFEFMLAHKDKFDDLLVREHSEKIAGLPPGSDSAKVRNGQVGAHRHELESDVSAELDLIWEKQIGDRFGLPSYQALRDALAEEKDSLQ